MLLGDLLARALCHAQEGTCRVIRCVNGPCTRKCQSDFHSGYTSFLSHQQYLDIPAGLLPSWALGIVRCLTFCQSSGHTVKYWDVNCISPCISKAKRIFTFSFVCLFPSLRNACSRLLAPCFSFSCGFLGVLYIFWMLILCSLCIFQMSSCHLWFVFFLSSGKKKFFILL